jgi:hypothetical protein
MTDVTTKTQFLIDTGADVSVIPSRYSDRSKGHTNLFLSAVNGTKIGTYGDRTLTLDFNFKGKICNKVQLAISVPVAHG